MRRIFDLHVHAGQAVRAIATILSAERIASPSGHDPSRNEHRPGHACLDSSAVRDYDQAMKDHLPNVMDALAKVAALSGEGFSRFRPVVLDMFNMDRDVADAAAEIDIDRTETIRRLAVFDHASDDLFDRFNEELADWADTRSREV